MIGVCNISPVERIMARIEMEPNTGCWIWMGYVDQYGYGQININGKKEKVHRVLYGVVPKGLEIDHLCRIHSCCNPDHLEAVTHKENCRRSPLQGHSLRKVNAAHRAKTHCPHGHEYTEQNTLKRRGVRECKTCARIGSLARYHKTKRTLKRSG